MYLPCLACSNYWIGVNDLYEEDLFRDVMLNEQLTYDNWKTEEPDNYFNSDCAVMQRADGEWTDYTCETFSIFAAGVICQQPPDPNPFTRKLSVPLTRRILVQKYEVVCLYCVTLLCDNENDEDDEHGGGDVK